MHLFTFLLGVIIGGFLSYRFLFSPKVVIKKLWREIFKVTEFRKKLEVPGDSTYTYIVVPEWIDDKISKGKRLINSLLDYYFDKEIDEEYIKNNRPN